MNPTKLASRMLFMAKTCRGEADRHTGKRREQLLHASAQLSYAANGAFRINHHEAAEAVLAAAIDLAVACITHRFERELEQGVTP